MGSTELRARGEVSAGMAKKRDVPGKRQSAAGYDGGHPGGVTPEEIAKVIADVRESFRRQSEFFSRARRGKRPQHRSGRHSR